MRESLKRRDIEYTNIKQTIKGTIEQKGLNGLEGGVQGRTYSSGMITNTNHLLKKPCDNLLLEKLPLCVCPSICAYVKVTWSPPVARRIPQLDSTC